jgi:hypothetical protein
MQIQCSVIVVVHWNPDALIEDRKR